MANLIGNLLPLPAPIAPPMTPSAVFGPPPHPVRTRVSWSDDSIDGPSVPPTREQIDRDYVWGSPDRPGGDRSTIIRRLYGTPWRSAQDSYPESFEIAFPRRDSASNLYLHRRIVVSREEYIQVVNSGSYQDRRYDITPVEVGRYNHRILVLTNPGAKLHGAKLASFWRAHPFPPGYDKWEHFIRDYKKFL